jgi:hypothetical protein
VALVSDTADGCAVVTTGQFAVALALVVLVVLELELLDVVVLEELEDDGQVPAALAPDDAATVATAAAQMTSGSASKRSFALTGYLLNIGVVRPRDTATHAHSF